MKNFRMRKVIAVVMAIAMMMTTVFVGQMSIFADDNISYTFDPDTGALVISGSGAMDDYDEGDISTIPWYGDRHNIKSVTISEGITHIGAYSFARSLYVNEVTLPSTLTSIGRAAFAGDDELLSLTIPDSVTEIGDYAFGFTYDMSLTSGFVANCSSSSAAQQYCIRSYVPFNTDFDASGDDRAVVKAGNWQAMWSFVPAASGTVTFWSTGGSDTKGLIYDSSNYIYGKYNDMEKSALAFNDDNGSNVNFNLVYTVTAGKRYYLSAKYQSAVKTGSFDVHMNFVCDEHNYSASDDTATCTQGGAIIYTCVVCGDTYTSITDPLNHDPADPVIENEVEPTCTAKGSYDSVVYCKRCSTELSRESKEKEMVAHKYSVISTVNPTCTDQGYNVYQCSACLDTYHDDFVEPNGHIYDTEKLVQENIVPSTCTENGTFDWVLYCTVCHAELDRQQDFLELAEHTPDEMKIENKVAATCTEDGSHDEVVRCIECGTVLSVNPVTDTATGHNYVHSSIAPTCTKDGAEVDTCSKCGDVISTTVPASGHSYTAIDFADGEVGIVCTVCDHYKTLVFMDYLNAQNELLDIVEDGIVNAKDYAKFKREYPARDVACDIDLTAGTVSRDNATLADGVLTLTPAGRYAFFNITGESDGVRIVVNASSDCEIKLNNANMTVDSANAIEINNTATDGAIPEVSISATDGTENSITVTTTGNAVSNYSDNGACKVELKGHGVLTLDTASTAINSGAKVSIKNITLNITSGNRGIDTKFTGADGIEDYANVGIKGNANITINSNDDGIRCKNFETEVLADGDTDSVLNITSTVGDGIQMEGKKSVLNSGKVTINAAGYVFNCKDANFSVKSGATVDGTGTKGYSK